MIDNRTLEEAGLYALGLLEGAELDAFERRLRHEPGLRPYVEQMRDAVAGVALTAPAAAPPAAVLADVLVRIDHRHRQGAAAIPWGWAAAAGLAILLGLSLLGRPDPGGAPPSASGQAPEGGAPANTGGQPATPADALLDELERDLRERQPGDPAGTPGIHRRALTLVQDIGRLRREVSELRRAHESRFEANPNLARTVVVELVEPDATEPQPAGDEGDEGSPLSERVSDLIAAAIEEDAASTVQEGGADPASHEDPSAPQAQQDPETNHGPAGSPEPEPPIPPAATLSADDITETFKQLAPGVVFDQAENRLWIESSARGVYLEEPLPSGFDYDEFEDFSPDLPRPGSRPPPTDAPAAAPEAARSTASVGPLIATALAPGQPPDPGAFVSGPPAAAYSIYDETTGDGSVVVANLPPLPPGESFHLWLRNSTDDKLVNVGMLPGSPQTVERFDFSLEASGVSPSGFFITREPSPEPANPSAHVILRGP